MYCQLYIYTLYGGQRAYITRNLAVPFAGGGVTIQGIKGPKMCSRSTSPGPGALPDRWVSALSDRVLRDWLIQQPGLDLARLVRSELPQSGGDDGVHSDESPVENAPLPPLSSGCIDKTFRGTHVAGHSTLQLLEINLRPGVRDFAAALTRGTTACSFKVSDGDHIADAISFGSGFPALFEAGVNGLIDCCIRMTGPGELILNRIEVKFTGPGLHELGDPLPWFLGVHGGGGGGGGRDEADLRYFVDWPGSDATPGGPHERVPPYRCHGECRVVPVEDREGYSGSVTIPGTDCVCTSGLPGVGDPSVTRMHFRKSDRPRIDQDDPESAEPQAKRYALYRWVARNWFRVEGKLRATLPPCVVTCIRSKYPNPLNTPYTVSNAY